MISSTALQWLASTSAPTPRRVKKWAAKIYIDRLVASSAYEQAPPLKNPEYLAVHIADATAKGGR